LVYYEIINGKVNLVVVIIYAFTDTSNLSVIFLWWRISKRSTFCDF